MASSTPGVEECAVVVRPSAAVGHAGDRLGRLLPVQARPRALVDPPEAQPEALVAAPVRPVGQPPMVRAQDQVADGEVGAVAGQGVLVQDDLLVRVGRRDVGGFGVGRCGAPAVDGIVAAAPGPVVVPPGPEAGRRGDVGLLDAPDDLGRRAPPGARPVARGPPPCSRSRPGGGPAPRVSRSAEPEPLVDADVPMGRELPSGGAPDREVRMGEILTTILTARRFESPVGLLLST